MRHIQELSPSEARRLSGLIFDLDDTFLDGTRVNCAALSSLHELAGAGMLLVAATGRPAVWAELAVRQWPIDAGVGENGAVACYRDGGRVVTLDWAGDARASRVGRLNQLVAALRREFPGLRPSDDAHLRISDFTFDIGEHETVPTNVVEAACAYAQSRGARTHTSSVHLHVTFDALDKAAATVRLLATRFSIDRSRALGTFAFIGDSANDASCFAAFRTTIGVSNLRGRLSIPPRFITTLPRGQGFAQAASTLADARRS